MSKATTVRIPGEMRDRIDAARGDVSQQRWIHRAIEVALGGGPVKPPPTGVEPSRVVSSPALKRFGA